MADENKDQGKPMTGGMDTGSTGQFRSDAPQSMAGTAGSTTTSTTGSTLGSTAASRGSSALTGGLPAGGEGMHTGSTTTGSGTAHMRDSLKAGTAGMADSARHYAGDMASRAKEKGRSLFEQQKQTALGQVSSVAGAIRSTAHNLEGEGQGQTAHYVQLLADQLESLGGRLRQKDLDTLVRDAESIARRSPGTFLAGSVAVGFLLARFLKSSAEREQYRSEWEDDDTIAAGEAGPYVGAASAASVGADGTPGSTAGTTGSGASPTGLTGANLGGDRL